MVQEVGHEHEEDCLPPLDTAVGDTRRQMGLTGSAWTCKRHPPHGLFSEPDGGLQGCTEQPLALWVGRPAAGRCVGKANAAQRSQIAVLLKARRPLFLGI